MWWKQATLEYPQAVILIAGRLTAGASTLVPKLRLERPIDQRPPMRDAGADAIVRTRTPAAMDAGGNIVAPARSGAIVCDAHGAIRIGRPGLCLDRARPLPRFYKRTFVTRIV
jgi:hypothetical protein